MTRAGSLMRQRDGGYFFAVAKVNIERDNKTISM